jgi:esterase
MAVLPSYRIGDGARSTVLLHGFLGAGKNLRSLAQRWGARDPRRTLLVPDLTGHGAAPPLPPGANLNTLAGDVLETASTLPAPLSLVGHSLGGRVALAAARRAPSRVGEVVLLDIAPGPLDDRRASSRRVLDALLAAPAEAPGRRDLREHLVAAGVSPDTADWLVMNVRVEDGRARWTFDRQALDRLQEATKREDLWDVVESRAVSVRCIRGGRSHYVLDEDVERFAAAACPVLTLPDAGHEVHVDAPQALLDALA